MICPKCGAHIKRFNLKPNCGNCGVNIMLYTQERELTRDAKRAELEYAKARIFVAKLKAAFISGKLTISRLVMTLLCVGVLAVPGASVKIVAPLFETELSLGAIGIYKMVSNGVYAVIFDFAGISLVSSQVKLWLVCAAVFVLLLLCVVGILVAELLSFINIKKTAVIINGFSVAAAVLAVACAVTGFVLKAGAGEAAFVSVSAGFIGFAAVPVFIAMIFLNKKILSAGIEPKVSENDYLRAATLKKVKAGEISLDDLTLPVFETEQEREERIKAFLEEEARADGGVTVE